MGSVLNRILYRLQEQRKSVYPPKRIIFLHIPKTAGATIRTTIKNNYAESKTRVFRGTVAELDDFANSMEIKKRSLDAVIGHLPFGIHHQLGNDFKYAAVLRHPAERVRSLYDYAKTTPNHYLQHRINNENLSLSDTIDMEISPEFSNGQVRLLAGNEDCDGIRGCGPVAKADFDTAVYNLNAHFIVGIQVEFEKSLQLFGDHFGWRTTRFVSKNVVSKKTELDATTIQKIEDANRFDIELYESAVQLFRRQSAE